VASLRALVERFAFAELLDALAPALDPAVEIIAGSAP
jgi:hypothetical protein